MRRGLKADMMRTFFLPRLSLSSRQSVGWSTLLIILIFLGGPGCSFLPEPEFSSLHETRDAVVHHTPALTVTKPLPVPEMAPLLEQLKPGESRRLPEAGTGNQLTLLDKYTAASGELCCVYSLSSMTQPMLACKIAGGRWMSGRCFLPAIAKR